MDIFDVLSLIGGIAMLLYGMKMMGDGLERMAGGKLEHILERLTSNKFKGVLLGAGVTAVIQSSAATTVMVVGFINSGIMKLQQSVGIIMGANIGTTVTAWILSLTGLKGDSVIVNLLKPSSFAPIFAVLGVAVILLAKRGRKRDIGTVCFGFALLMYGMLAMSSAVSPLAESETFANLLSLFTNPILGVLVGALMTAAIQSSSASVGILQAMSATGLLSFSAAVPILCGQNIGTTVTALLSSTGANRNAKRAAVIHLLFNVFGTILFLSLFYIVRAFVDLPFLSGKVDTFEIAMVHTVFNLFTTLALLPFSKLLVRLSELIIRDKPESEEFALLDERFVDRPAFALEHCRDVTDNMAALSRDNLLLALSTLDKFSAKSSEQITENEDKVDMYEDKLGSYLVKLSGQDLSVHDTNESAVLLSAIGDFERISDHAVNILEAAEEMHEKNIEFSGEARKEISVITAALSEILTTTVEAFLHFDIELASRVEPLEEVIDLLKNELRARHISRLQDNKCTIEYGFVFNDLLTNFERVSDHCSNIAISVLQSPSSPTGQHDYLNTVIVKSDSYNERVKAYSEKYFGMIDTAV